MDSSTHRTLRIIFAAVWLVLTMALFLAGILNSPLETTFITLVVVMTYVFWGIAAAQEDLTVPYSQGRVAALSVITGLVLGFLGVGYSLGVLDFLRASQEHMEISLTMGGVIMACISGAITAISLRNTPAYTSHSTLIRYHVIALLAGAVAMTFMWIVTASRNEKFAGMAAALGLFATIIALFWVLGAGILSMFLREKYDLQMAAKEPPKQPQASFLDDDPLPLI